MVQGTKFQSTHPRRVWHHKTFDVTSWDMFQSTHPRRVWQLEQYCASKNLKFQSTHPRRVWLIVMFKDKNYYSFNPHTHEGCDWLIMRPAYISSGFNPHTHEGCDIQLGKLLTGNTSFNPHTHEGCDAGYIAPHTFEETFQSTHPRRVWLLQLFHQIVRTGVSIHTPTKGVTYFWFPSYYFTLLFQSTHPRRVWLRLSCLPTCSVCFNPHTHEGCDLANPVISAISLVSIHTPTKGVTLLALLIISPISFQSTHPRRVWLKEIIKGGKVAEFQSTHPRRVWPVTATYIKYEKKFQSTHPRRVWLK